MAELEDRLAGLTPALHADSTGGDFADVLRRRNRNRVTRTASVAAVVLAMVGGSALAASSLGGSDNSAPSITSTLTSDPTPTDEPRPDPTALAEQARREAAARASAMAMAAQQARIASFGGLPLAIQDVTFTTGQDGYALGERCRGNDCINPVFVSHDAGASWSLLTTFDAGDGARAMSHLLVGRGSVYGWGPGIAALRQGAAAPVGLSRANPVVALGELTRPHEVAGLDADCRPSGCYLEFLYDDGAGFNDTIVNSVSHTTEVMAAVISGEYGLFALSNGHGLSALGSVAGSDGTQFTTTSVPCRGASKVSMSTDKVLSIWMLCTAADGSTRLFHATDGRHFAELGSPGATPGSSTLAATPDSLWRWTGSVLQRSTSGRNWVAATPPGFKSAQEQIVAFHAVGKQAVLVVREQTAHKAVFHVFTSQDGSTWVESAGAGLQ
ncbi:MAG: hypothetical protein QOK42_1745 [Frankiaceae bacterium]|nr:hypothetical protein [Frankiaceae bacterium]